MVRWRPVLFPLDQSALFLLLPERGYVISEDILNQRAPFGARIEAGGTVARKGRMALIFDLDRPGMALDGVDSVEIMREFDELEHLLAERFRLGQTQARYYELDVQALVSSHGTPIDFIRSQPSQFQEPIGQLLGHPVSRYSLRMCSTDHYPIDEDWYDLTIEPVSRSMGIDYNTVLMFRNSSRPVVVDVANRALEIFSGLADIVEGK